MRARVPVTGCGSAHTFDAVTFRPVASLYLRATFCTISAFRWSIRLFDSIECGGSEQTVLLCGPLDAALCTTLIFWAIPCAAHTHLPWEQRRAACSGVAAYGNHQEGKGGEKDSVTWNRLRETALRRLYDTIYILWEGQREGGARHRNAMVVVEMNRPPHPSFSTH